MTLDSAHGQGGVLLLDKTAGPSSHDVVRAARRLLRTRQIGHTGTLDPIATGLLVLLVGQSTRLASFAQGADKAYRCTLELGIRTATHDCESEVSERVDASRVTDKAVLVALGQLRGEIMQVPPAFSAVHVDGERAYQKARRGEHVEIAPRPINVSTLELAKRRGAELELDVTVSSGGYVRSLVRDLGELLGCGATMYALRRLRVGHFEVSAAQELGALSTASVWQEVQAPVEVFPHDRRLSVDHTTAMELWSGRQPGMVREVPTGFSPWIACLDKDVVGVVEPVAGSRGLRMVRGFPCPQVAS